MLKWFFFTFLVLTNLCFAQTVGNPGGGLPSHEIPEDIDCVVVMMGIIDGEKKFLADHNKKYKTEEDFFKFLEELKMAKFLDVMTWQPSQYNCGGTLKAESDLYVLLYNYQAAGEKGFNCIEFKSRIGKEKLIQEVLDLYKVSK